MDMPSNLKIAIEEMANNINHSELISKAQTLSEKYRHESGKGERLLTSDNEALAYAISRMPATFGAVSSALEHTLLLTDIKPETLLDVGAGTGAASLAADMALPLKKIICLEREQAMIDLGRKLSKNGSEAMQNSTWINFDLNASNLPEKADLVIVSYVLNELSEEKRLQALDKIWKSTNKILLIVEPGTPEAFRQVKITREYMCGLGAHIIAPCTHECKCPIPNNDWCHFAVRVARTRLHKQLKGGDAPYEDECFTYLALSKENTHTAKARVLRHPQIRTKMIMLNLCTNEGIKNITLTKKDDTYKQARKAKIGDEIKI